MNASLNAVVGDISKKIKEQEEERLAQDAENSSLRSDLQVIDGLHTGAAEPFTQCRSCPQRELLLLLLPRSPPRRLYLHQS